MPFADYQLPTFPLDVLPASLRAWVAAEAEETQTPTELAALLALAAASAAVTKRYEVRVRDEWHEPVNLYALVALDSGERKSVVFRHATEPLREWEREERWRRAPRLRRANEEREIAAARLREAKTRAAKATEDERATADDEVFELADRVAETRAESELQLVADDATPEAIAQLLHEQRGRLALLSPEGGGVFEMARGRYQSNGRANLDVYLKAYGGDELRVNRKGSGPLFVRAPYMTVALAVQPCVLDGLAEVSDFRGRGLLGRFVYAIPSPRAGYRSARPDAMPGGVRAVFHRILKSLCELPETRDDDGEIKSTILDVTSEARDALTAFSADVEPMLRDGGDLEAVRDFANRLPGTATRIAALLHLWEAVSRDGASTIGPVDLDAVTAAIRLVREFLLPHALAAFGAMGADPNLVGARHVLRWIERTGATRFSKRDAFEGTKAHFERANYLDQPLRVLEERSYIRRLPDPEGRGRGRPSSPEFVVNARGIAPHKSHNSVANGASRFVRSAVEDGTGEKRQ